MADLKKKENEVVKEHGFSEGQMAKNKSWLGKGKKQWVSGKSRAYI